MSSVIGTPALDPGAYDKAAGTAQYPADTIRPDMLHLQVVFAHRPHARILTIDTRKALRHPGVVAVFTSADVPYNAFGMIIPDQPVLCDDVVRFVGDKVALVVAETKESAIAGAKLVEVAYEDLPAVINPFAAMAAEAPLVHQNLSSNILLHIPIHKGNTDSAFAEADVVLDGTFETSWQEHAYLQPEAGSAYLDEQGRLVIETAGQWMHDDRRQIAQILQLPDEQVVIRYTAIGGAFGGKEDLSVQHLLALATWKLRRPTAIVWSREESIIAHHKRHPFNIQCRWAAQKDGRITAVETRLIADGGAYASVSLPLIQLATILASGCYEIPNISADGYVVYTNNVPAGAFRGFGATQVMFASEVMVTRLAHALGIDPIEMRQRNLYREGSLDPTQQPLPAGVSALPVLERCLKEAQVHLYDGQPRQSSAPHLRRGVGIACGMKNIGYSLGYRDQATASIELSGAGDLKQATVRVGIADLGQGSSLALRQIAAETLALPLEQITLISHDSSQAPDAGGTSASRTTFIAGRAVKEAALDARKKWEETDDEYISATKHYLAPLTTPIMGGGQPNLCYGYAAQAIEVEVNMLTGQVRVVKVISVHDAGRIINPQRVEGQIEGGIAQALGFTLLEDFQCKEGHVLTSDFTTYLLPTIADMPEEIIPVVLELADPDGPYGARGIAEMSLLPFAPAVAHAIYAATGVWINQLPMTPERVMQKLQERKNNL